MPSASASLAVWSSAWLAGAAASDDVLDAMAAWSDAHDVVAADAAAAAVLDLPTPDRAGAGLAALLVLLRLTCAAVASLIIGLIISKLADYQDPESEAEFERIVLRSEELARENLAAEPDEGSSWTRPYNPADFETLVRDALDDLPDLLLKALDRIPVVVSDKGRKVNAYGLYQGDTVARDNYHDRIIIFRDTLLRDFGHDPDLLRDRSRGRFGTSWRTTWARMSSGCASSAFDVGVGGGRRGRTFRAAAVRWHRTMQFEEPPSET